VVGLADSNRPRVLVVTAIQSFRRDIPEARAGANVGLLLRAVIEPGMRFSLREGGHTSTLVW
jgi:translation elongation factor EF-Tu-like GTPase